MAKASELIHPNWDKAPAGITDGFSLEMTAKDEGSLRDAAPLIPAGTPVAITYLPGEELAARVAATVAVRELGFEPMPHFSARRITSQDDFEGYLKAVVEQAGVKRCFIVAGDPPEPQGPYFDTMALIRTGAFERAGVQAIGVGGHPEGHPNMTEAQCWDVLEAKVREIAARYPHNVNAMVACALATVGLDRCRARLVADPAIDHLELIVEARGRDGSSLSIRRRQPARGVSGSEMAAAVYSSVRRAAGTSGPMAFV